MTAEQALTRIEKRADGCWDWLGAHTAGGYAHMRRGGRKDGHAYVHRALYEHLVGPIPQGFELDHLCRNRGCVNPDHLEPVTHTENVRRGAAAFVVASGECRRGHAREEHGYWRPDGRGYNCRACARELRAAL